VVTGVHPQGRGAEAGLREGDVIRSVDGEEVGSAGELRSLLSQTPERPALVLVQRGEHSFFATIG
jgi:S1-C subfamily serine protease